ncbi:MAG: N-acetyltransferase [Rhodospirillales bacterium 20-64-7]|nr:MAG: N-acetyltransferase [Rhodospirillales bacterium 20-64-7]HQT77612.1 GNAT family N-acetyltransferase [Rhodopila sp.]
MTQDFTLRDATASDTAAILRLIRALADYERLSHTVTATEAELHAALFGRKPRADCILADVAERSVGLALFYYTFSTFKARPIIFLEDLFVEPAHRGAGIGLALMRHLARRAVAEGCQSVEWRVLNWNQPSIAFYQSLGAKQIEDWQTRQLSGGALAALAKGSSHG